MNENINQTLRELLTRVMLFRLKQSQHEDEDIVERYIFESESLIELIDESIYRGIYPYMLDWAAKELREYQKFIRGYLSGPDDSKEIQQSISQVIQRLAQTSTDLKKSKTFKTIDRIARNLVTGEYFHLLDLANVLYNLTEDTIRKLNLSADTSVRALLQSEIPRQAKINTLIDLSEKLFRTLSPEIGQYQPLFVDLLAQYKHVNIALISGIQSIIEPISVEANFERGPRHAHDNNIYILPKEASSKSFEESVKNARLAAHKFLTAYQEYIPCQDFHVQITLGSDIPHADRSAELPIALAIIAQRFDWKMNPRIVAVGNFDDYNPTKMDFVDEKGKEVLAIKLKAVQDTDGVENLLTPAYIPGRRFQNIQTTIQNLDQAVREYFGEQWSDTQEKRKRILVSVPPHRYVHRQQDVNQCVLMSQSHPILMITGLRGIGKSVLLDGLMRRIYQHYDGICRINIHSPKNPEAISFEVPYQEIARFLEKHGDLRLVKSQMMMSSEEKAEIILENLQKRRFMLIFDDFNYLLNRNRKIADTDCLTLVNQLINNQMQFGDSRVIFVSNTNVFELTSASVETYKLPGFSYEEMVNYLQKLGGELPSARILGSIFEATGGHPWVLKAIHNLAEIGYRYEDILANKNEYLLGDEEEDEDFSIGDEDDLWSVKKLLNPVLEKIGESDKAALCRFSVYREPVSDKGWRKLMTLKNYHKLDRYFLVEGANGLFWEHAIVRDYAHLLLAQNREEYRRCHSIAAGYYEEQESAL